MKTRQLLSVLGLAAALCCVVGCTSLTNLTEKVTNTKTGLGRIFYELQPHRLWRLNQTPGPTTDTSAYFSVSSSLPQPPAISSTPTSPPKHSL